MAEQFGWRVDGHPIEVGFERLGRGPQVLMLPAPSSVSMRSELAPLARLLAADLELLLPDWPGFGTAPAPALRWAPRHFQEFLQAFTARHLRPPFAIVAAGHAAAYALDLAAVAPGSVGRIMLVAPTWRGPLPTVAGGYRPWQERVRAAVEAPYLGEALYRLNVSRPVLAMMLKGHVLADPEHLTAELLTQKSTVTRRPAARFATAAFVTGGLDLVRSREAFLRLAERAAIPVLAVWGPQAPPRSAAEMAALAQVEGVRCAALPVGALGVHEEYAPDVATLARPFLLAG